MEIYLIKHVYDVDGGFGDAITNEEVIGYVTSQDEAVEYCEKYSKPFVYDTPYANLYKGELIYEKLPNYLNINTPPFPEEFYKKDWDDDEDEDIYDDDYDNEDNND